MVNPLDIEVDHQCLRVMVASTRENLLEEQKEPGVENEHTKREQNLPRLSAVQRRSGGSECEEEA